VFWTEYQPDSHLYLIRGNDLSTGDMLTVGAPGNIGCLSAGGGLLLWADDPGDTYFDIFAYNLSSSQLSTIAAGPGLQRYPSANDDYIVWEDARSVESRIYAMDRRTGTEFRLSNSNTLQVQPAIGERYIVWDDDRYQFFQDGTFAAHDIMAYDLQTGQEITVTKRAGMQMQPAVSGDVVVWVDTRDSNFDIYGKNLATGEEFPISVVPGEQNEPSIDGNIVVWLDGRPDAPGIYGYDLSTGQEFPIKLWAGPANLFAMSMSFPKVSGNLVVWKENTSIGDQDIYGAYVPEPASMTCLLLVAGALLRRSARRADNS
jgi:beta propeller repeat protein